MELLNRLLEAQDAAVELRWDADVLAEELGEAAGAEAGGAGEPDTVAMAGAAWRASREKVDDGVGAGLRVVRS